MVLRSGRRIKEDDVATMLTDHFNPQDNNKLIIFNKEETGKEVKKKPIHRNGKASPFLFTP
jgi:hypothetical protein